MFLFLLNFSITSKLCINEAVRSRRSGTSTFGDDEQPEITGRVAGTVRRHIPIDTRDATGAILHFYVGDPYDTNRSVIRLLTASPSLNNELTSWYLFFQQY